MDRIHSDSHKRGDYVLKTNLWKFLKTLRVQANPIYCLLVASPIHCAWVTIIDKEESASQKRIAIAQFVNLLKKKPSTNKRYCLSVALYHISDDAPHTSNIYEAVERAELTVETFTRLYPAILAKHCVEAHKRGERFELSPQTILHYKFKARYIDELQPMVERCNSFLTEQSNNSHQ